MRTPEASPTKDWALWWFAKLEDAIRAGDRCRLQEAMRNLDRLGIEIRFTLPATPRDRGEVQPEKGNAPQQ
jgi:hypothetical protein